MDGERKTYKTPGGKIINTSEKPITVSEWLDEGRRRFGPDPLDWKFQCPVCGRVYSVREHKEAGSSGPNSAYQECIGRYLGAEHFRGDNRNGCDWCAYGLFGTLWKGQLVQAEDGTIVEVFRFAKEGGRG